MWAIKIVNKTSRQELILEKSILHSVATLGSFVITAKGKGAKRRRNCKNAPPTFPSKIFNLKSQ
jgi:hypothetical protein